jgi:hypothetical protein
MRRRNRPASRQHRNTSGRVPRFEQLEPRAMLSVVPVGSEFNAGMPGPEWDAAVARDNDGDTVIAWASNDEIYAKRYNAAGVAQGSHFAVSTFGGEYWPVVGMDADGDFVVVWEGYDANGRGVYAQRYDAAGVAQLGDFRVNTNTSFDQDRPAVAMDDNGNFVVVWETLAAGEDGLAIFAQRYNAAGAAQGMNFRVNTYTTNNQFEPAVAMDANGDFVVTWTSTGQEGSGGNDGIYAQRYNAAGVAQGTEFRVNTYTTNFQVYPAVAMDDGGDFVVAWGSNLQDGSNYGVYAQRYNASGIPQGAEFPVNTHTAGNQGGRIAANLVEQSVTMDADGDFVIVWTSQGQDGSSAGIYAQAYDSAGTAHGGEFRVNTFTTNAQQAPVVAMDADGDFVVAWESNLQDGSGFGVYAQRYALEMAPTTTGFADIYVPEGAANTILSLWAAFADEEDADSALTYTLQSNTNPALFTSTNINPGTGQLTLDYAPNKYGTGTITVRATDTTARFVETTFRVTIVYPGDYNRNGFVETADWIVWRKQSGATGVTPYFGADGNGDGDIDADDQIVWERHYGETVPSGAGGGGMDEGGLQSAGSKSASASSVEAAIGKSRDLKIPRRARAYLHSTAAGRLHDHALVAWLSLTRRRQLDSSIEVDSSVPDFAEADSNSLEPLAEALAMLAAEADD